MAKGGSLQKKIGVGSLGYDFFIFFSSLITVDVPIFFGPTIWGCVKSEMIFKLISANGIL